MTQLKKLKQFVENRLKAQKEVDEILEKERKKVEPYRRELESGDLNEEPKMVPISGE